MALSQWFPAAVAGGAALAAALFIAVGLFIGYAIDGPVRTHSVGTGLPVVYSTNGASADLRSLGAASGLEWTDSAGTALLRYRSVSRFVPEAYSSTNLLTMYNTAALVSSHPDIDELGRTILYADVQITQFLYIVEDNVTRTLMIAQLLPESFGGDPDWNQWGVSVAVCSGQINGYVPPLLSWGQIGPITYLGQQRSVLYSHMLIPAEVTGGAGVSASLNCRGAISFVPDVEIAYPTSYPGTPV